MFIPKAISYFKSIKNRPTYSAAIRPPPPGAQRALNVLFIASILALITSLPYFAPPDIFHQTQSRLKIPTNTLFVRLAALSSPPGTLSEYQTTLQQHIGSLESRLLYFTYGPDVMTYCKFCDPDDANSYFYFAIPSILAPHLLHIGILALCTSGLLAGPEGRKWRTPATMAGAGLAIMELGITSLYNYKENAMAERLTEIYPFFWKMRIYRSGAISAILAATGFLLYQSSTNRWFVEAPEPFRRVDMATARLGSARTKIGHLTWVRNAALRDKRLRAVHEDYWLQEADVLAEKLQDKEVMEGLSNAVNERFDMNLVTRDVDAAVNAVFRPFEERIDARLRMQDI